MTKQAVLIVDGLPVSHKSQDLQKQLSKDYDVYYCSFVDALSDLRQQSVIDILDNELSKAAYAHESILIIAVSFGAYIIAHSNDLLKKYSGSIKKIVLYSPVARLADVKGISTLPEYLNNTYVNSHVTEKNLTDLDKSFNSKQLISEEIKAKTKMIVGDSDEQLPVKALKKYYAHYDVVVTNESHIGLSSLVSRKKPEWM